MTLDNYDSMVLIHVYHDLDKARNEIAKILSNINSAPWKIFSSEVEDVRDNIIKELGERQVK